MAKQRRFVLDTSLFVNPHAREHFGKDPKKAVMGFVKIARKIKNCEFYMPTSVFRELRNFITEKEANELEVYVKKRAPDTYSIFLPAAVLNDFIEDVRSRLNKGLRLAEEFAQDNRPENEEKLKKLRDKYRDAMRTGLVDSREDFEILLLAKQLEATIISSDEGVIKFADKIGCEWLNASKFHNMLRKQK